MTSSLKDRALKLLPEGTDPAIIHKVTGGPDGIRVLFETGTEILLKPAEDTEVEVAPRSTNLGAAAAAEERRLRQAAATTPAGPGDEATGQNYGLPDAPTIFPEVTKAEVDYDAVDEDGIDEVKASDITAALKDPEGTTAGDEDEKPSTVKQLKAALDDLGVEYDSRARKADLEKLYAEATG